MSVPDLAQKPTWVYRFLDADWRILYVGITHDREARISQHARRPFWPQVMWTAATLYPDRIIAEAIEARLIADENPVYNIDAGSRRARTAILPDETALWGLELDYVDYCINDRLFVEVL